MAAHQDGTGALSIGPTLHLRVRKRHTGGRKQHHGRMLPGWLGPVSADGLQALPQRLRLHDHARPTAKGAVVHTAINPFGKIAQLPELDGNLPRGKGATRDAHFKHRAKQFGEKGDDVKPHGIRQK